MGKLITLMAKMESLKNSMEKATKMNPKERVEFDLRTEERMVLLTNEINQLGKGRLSIVQGDNVKIYIVGLEPNEIREVLPLRFPDTFDYENPNAYSIEELNPMVVYENTH